MQVWILLEIRDGRSDLSLPFFSPRVFAKWVAYGEILLSASLTLTEGHTRQSCKVSRLRNSCSGSRHAVVQLCVPSVWLQAFGNRDGLRKLLNGTSNLVFRAS